MAQPKVQTCKKGYKRRIDKFLENGRDLQIKQLRQSSINDYETFFNGGEPNSMKDDYLERGDICLL